MQRKKEKEFYQVFPIRLDKRTKEALKKEYKKNKISWNLFILKLLNAYYANGTIKRKT